jgi:kynurenine formamidase
MIEFKKFFDLSQPVFEKCPGWPTYEMTTFRYEAFYPNDGYTAEQITMNSHTGTHVDAPFHFDPSGKTIDEFSVDTFCGEQYSLICGRKSTRKRVSGRIFLNPMQTGSIRE